MLRDTLTKQLQSLSKALEEILMLRKLERLDKATEVLERNFDTGLLAKLQSNPDLFHDPKLSEQIKYLIYFQNQHLKMAQAQNLPNTAALSEALKHTLQHFLKANQQTYYMDLEQLLQSLNND